MNAQQLKNSILQDAIMGKLVPQDPNDEPASVLLDKIRKEKARLVKEGKLKKKDLIETPISKDEIPFEIPEGWEWVRWGVLGEYKKGPFGSSLTKSMFVPKSDEAVKVYEQKNAIQKDYTLGEYYISKEKYETMKGFTVHPGEIIVSCAGTIGETYLLPDDAPIGIINQALMRAKLHLDSIIPYWLLHFRYILLIENKLQGAGSAIKNIPPFEVLKAMPVPLPPLAEQHRIVAKIEELLPKVEEYGKAQEALDKLNAEMPERLKKSILQEAIMGKLVPQDPNDEPASVLLDKIRKEKARLVKEGKLKKKDLIETPISEDEKPFEIPENWEWCKLGTITTVLGGKRIPAGRKLSQENTGHIYIRVSDMKENTVSTDNLQYVPKDIFPSISKYIINKEDVYITVAGTIGKIGKIPPELDGANLTENADRLVFTNLNQDWLIKCLQSNTIQVQIADVTTKVGQPKLAILRIQNLLIPLPPLAEQHRIVTKIEKLLTKIDKLNTK